jgi:hypothetical protein
MVPQTEVHDTRAATLVPAAAASHALPCVTPSHPQNVSGHCGQNVGRGWHVPGPAQSPVSFAQNMPSSQSTFDVHDGGRHGNSSGGTAPHRPVQAPSSQTQKLHVGQRLGHGRGHETPVAR